MCLFMLQVKLWSSILVIFITHIPCTVSKKLHKERISKFLLFAQTGSYIKFLVNKKELIFMLFNHFCNIFNEYIYHNKTLILKSLRCLEL